MTIPALLRPLRFLLAFTSFLFVSQQISWLFFLHFFSSNTPFYLAFIALGSGACILLGKVTRWKMGALIYEALSFFLPVAIFFAIGLSLSHEFHFLVFLSVGLYVITAFSYWTFTVITKRQKESGSHPSEKISPSALFSFSRLKKKHGLPTLASVFFITLLFFSFGLSHLTKFAAVDEPLWMDGRIMRFWKNLGERDLDKTSISDKPGITVVLSSGPGLLFVVPKDYRDTRFIFSAKNPDLDIKEFYLAFRLPLLIIITLFLPFFYFLLAPLLGTASALYSYAFIALSPILIGMSKIVNPDSLLWLFVPLSFFAYLIFLEKKTFRTLILSGIFLGLALLTKYVANFLVIFFFGYIFLRYILIKNDSALSFAEYFKKELTHFGIWLGTGLSVFYLLFPAVWIAPGDLITGTILSQAFEKVAALFIGLIGVILIDQYLFGSRAMTSLMEFGRRKRIFIEHFFGSLFLLIAGFTLANGMLGMPWIDFMDVVASPKSTYKISTHIDIFLTNFYPLLFGVPTLLLLSAFIALFAFWYQKRANTTRSTLILSIIIFIFLYFLGSTVNQVVLINRYQIILYPLMGVLAGIGFGTGIEWLREKYPLFRTLDTPYRIGLFLLVIILTTVLIRTPFPLSFSSGLLPLAYTVDIKDMGSGSYEAAEYLNSLPDSKDLAIWTDKRGVCKFFVGVCTDGFDFKALPAGGLDYVVISAGRASRTERMMANPYLLNDEGLVRFDTYYEKSDPVWELLINGRPGQFVKIFPFDESL